VIRRKKSTEERQRKSRKDERNGVFVEKLNSKIPNKDLMKLPL